ncbi:MAG TPA: tetratricopeptide repeat protein [Kofleriaceae bacterium]|nr:tetratricopeptide repeat protein [Kofleriaceae bacterium]
MEVTVDGSEPGADAPPDDLPRGTTIHRYVVLERLGAGAMGVVYAAYDYGLDRRVALKLVSDPARRSARQRLVREAQALARLSHPAVIAVHDVGTWQGGVFVAMELVEGTTLRAWLDDRPRELDEVMAVFARAGEGLAAAHAAGIVHRDFKPANVLLDRTGAARVGDFGLASIGQDGDDADDGEDRLAVLVPGPADLTRTGAAVGTPAYMAPEQARDPAGADARADQYSFCVALHEALTGERPASGGATPDRAPPTWLAAALRRGLSVDPAARFPSMDALLAAIRRPAAPVRRRRMLMMVAALVVAGGVAGALALRAGAGRDRPCSGAVRELDGVWDGDRRAALRAGFAAAGDAAGAARVERALDSRARAWIAMHTDACRATRVSGHQSEAMMDLRMQCLDRRRAELRALTDLLVRPDAATAERAPRAVRELGDLDACADPAALAEVVPPPDARRREGARALRDTLAAVHALFLTGRYDDARARIAPLAAEAQALAYRPVEAEVLLLRGRLEQTVGDLDAAEETLYQAVAAAEAGRAGEVAVNAWLHLVWVTGEEQGRHAEALGLARVARGALERMGGSPRLEAVLEDWEGVLYLDQGKLDEARARLERGLALREQVFGPEDPETAGSLQHLALLEQAAGRPRDAVPLHARARAIVEAALGPDHPEVVIYRNAEGAALYEAGRLDEALAIYRRSLEAAERGGGGESPVAAALHTNIGLVQWKRGRHEEARASHERSLAIGEALYGKGHPRTAIALGNLGLALGALGRHAEAVSALERSLAMQAPAAGAADEPDDIAELRDALEVARAALARRP